MTAGIKANSDGSAAIQVGGTDVITLTSGGAATFVTSPTTVQAGTAAAPSITFSGDTNTGIYSPGADQVAIATGGTAAVIVDSSQRVETGPLTVKRSQSGVTTELKIQNGNVGANSDVAAVFNTANGDWTVKVGRSTGLMTFTTASSVEALRLANAGDVTVPVGNVVIGTAGKGIDFSADANAATSTSELLDDYEEGTWTPTLVSTGATFTYTAQFGSYVKVGQMVLAQLYVLATASGTTSNACSLSGLPFASSNTDVSAAQYGGGFWSTQTAVSAPLVNANGVTTATLWKNGQVATQTAANMSGTYLVGTFMYRSNA